METPIIISEEVTTVTIDEGITTVTIEEPMTLVTLYDGESVTTTEEITTVSITEEVTTVTIEEPVTIIETDAPQGIPGRCENQVSKHITYNIDGSVNVVSDTAGTKTMKWSLGILTAIVGTGIYPTKTLTYTSGKLTDILL